MAGTMQIAAEEPRALCVDLDGTLLAADLFWEALLQLAKQRPAYLLRLPLWLLRGRAYLKHQVALLAPADARTLPYRPEVLALIERSRDAGRHVVLATGADESHASAVAAHLGLFGTVLASNGVENLSGRRKATSLARMFGQGQFEYVGNDWVDMPSWVAAGHATAVAVPGRLVRHLKSRVSAVELIGPERTTIRPLIRALRPQQWVKNLLVVVPLVTSHQIVRLDLLTRSLLTLVVFSACASAVYIANDVCDVQSDRRHPRKRRRPFAAGELSIPFGLGVSAALFAGALLLATFAIGPGVGAVLAVYAATSIAYSLRIKREPVADVFVLASLYVLRLFAGGVATGIAISTWLLTFAMFFFLNLALVKRYAEVSVSSDTVGGRGYRPDDHKWMHVVGISAGFMAILVLALYATAPEVTVLYRRPAVLVLLCPLLLYWITRTWFQASRNTIQDDPLLEAFRDPASYVVALVAGVILLAAV